ncbi:hypothetical protein MBM_01455 [Drepanopeziza brunnea f. sp. 'multigermtubi' MB_m1]|uniref:Uncharacterized protein n=1 Tax=Marssonina brunnea f. sp. multigermtubi (strain MB_m1) TaxID=1072389 RepID=K1XJA1_MARBU|nr:uncharacterized protein MBM_01455 [Drepanopeziza brunnea f. sp. 'multigermtubi' MB_m1]EKD20773.1 hypothetical protein MBM_01455 [Drepanopeziza brunnea f. sp. 'multigermtubi' MB_m1]
MLFKQNLLFTLAIAAAAAAAAAAAILRTLTFEPSLFLLDFFIKRLLILTTVKALNYNNCTAAFAAANTAFENFLALNAAFLRGVANSPGGFANRTFVRLNSLITANRSPVIRNVSSISLSPLALALAAFIALVAFAALVVPVAFIVVAFFALIITLTAFAAALAVVITFAKR